MGGILKPIEAPIAMPRKVAERSDVEGAPLARPLLRRRRRDPLGRLEQRSDDVHRQREDDRRVLVGCDHGERFEIAQLDRLRLAREDLGRLRELFRGAMCYW